jgi:uncharacterized protein YndB with AHSA1/START domain
MTTTATDVATAQVYRVFIRATAERIWEAITNPAFTAQYLHGSRIEFVDGRRVSHGPDGDLRADAAILEWQPPFRLAHGWRPLYDPELAAEPTSRVTWEIEPQDGGYCKLTVVHDQLEGAPKTAAGVSGDGWMLVLSGLKTLLETGEPLTSS